MYPDNSKSIQIIPSRIPAREGYYTGTEERSVYSRSDERRNGVETRVYHSRVDRHTRQSTQGARRVPLEIITRQSPQEIIEVRDRGRNRLGSYYHHSNYTLSTTDTPRLLSSNYTTTTSRRLLEIKWSKELLAPCSSRLVVVCVL